MKSLTIWREAKKQLARIHPSFRLVVLDKIEELAAKPEGLAKMVKQLKGRPEKALRVGDYRILFVETSEEIEIRAVAHRREVYR